MKVWQGLQLFVSILFGSVLFIMLFQLSSFAYEKFFNQAFGEKTVSRHVGGSELPKDDLQTEMDTVKDDSLQTEAPKQSGNSTISLVRPFPDWNFTSGKSITIQIEPGQAFSLLQWAKLEGLDTLADDDLSKVASLLWEGILTTPLSVVERHPSESLPERTRPGLEANIDRKKAFDFRFMNVGKTAVAFKLIPISETSLGLTISGLQTNQSVRFAIIQEKVLEPRTIVKYVSANDVKAGTTIAGKKGYTVKVVREYLDTAGNVVQTEVVTEDTYLPIYEIQYRIKQ